MKRNDYELILNDYLGKFTPLQQGKIDKALDKVYRYTLMDGTKKLMSRGEYTLYAMLEEDYLTRVSEYSGKKNYELYREGVPTFYSITKSEHDFANWIMENGLNGKEKYESHCNGLWILHEEKQAKEESERLEKERIEREVREENRKFGVWLNDSIKDYNDVGKINLATSIFSHLYGMENLRYAKELLVLIDNIDRKGCKERLKELLHTGNDASRKVFSHITGITLPSTNKDTKEKIDSITKDDYAATVKEYKPRKKSEPKENNEVEFYKFGNGFGWKKASGILWKHAGFDIFIEKVGNNTYNATEGRTGALVAMGISSVDGIKKEFKALLERKTKEVMEAKMLEIIEHTGLSPLYDV